VDPDAGRPQHVPDDAAVRRTVVDDQGAESGEMHGAESLGRTLYDFPNEPWEFRMDTARQCYDEVRHAEMAIQRLRELGGEIGMFPVQRWGFGKQIEPRDVVERLATLNLAFEARAMGFLKKIRQHFYKIGDEASALLFDFVLADEIPHAMVGHKWVPELTKDDPERYQRALRRRDEIIRAWTEIQEKARQNGKPGATLHDVGRVDEGRFMGSV
jgi:uncharacterized ferritin-like protein (DUF455 family)